MTEDTEDDADALRIAEMIEELECYQHRFTAWETGFFINIYDSEKLTDSQRRSLSQMYGKYCEQ